MAEESPKAGEPAIPKAEAAAGQPVELASEEGAAAAARPASKVASFRLRAEAHDTITARAKEAGISPRAWLEDAILTNRTQIVAKAAKHPDLNGLLFQVNRAGNNLNQIAHTLHGLRLANKLTPEHYEQHMATLSAIETALTEALGRARAD
ncbi:MAG: plasmid mobilization relaxosome protein MobC [Sphingomonas sp.]|uniref:Plasmid mobilization relaxosome protein MobC n=1 Tax=Variovorax paradoxus TaxID=34073 RepID=A0A2W5QFT3_VARPD|nr:plasmid mobilization relaxosome protein MobC [Sphingomonas sp.]PZQ76172.1 MAG: plasmid mobilization relaxosome protein MobC [Variovorax paradoxus]PZU71751.1 MAG: plasmid mobilization relaxosome protein MobC [Sphingomonas sp.]